MFASIFRRFRRPAHRVTAARRPARRQARPRLECLEDRTLPQASAVQLAATPNPSTFGQQVTFTATISSDDSVILDGSITFQDGSVPLVTLPVPSAQQASEQIVFPTPTALTVGTHAITATYNESEGPPNSAITSNTVTEVVNSPPSPQSPTSPTTSPTPLPAQPSAQISLLLFNNSPLEKGALAFGVSAYRFSVNNPGVVGKATGGVGAGKVQLNDFVLDLPVSNASPLLLQDLVHGERFGHALISVGTPDGMRFLTWSLRQVSVSRFGLMPQGSGEMQVEVDLTFGAIAGDVLKGQAGASPKSAPPVGLQLGDVKGGFVNGVLAVDGFTIDTQNPSSGGNAAGVGKASLRSLLVELPAGEATLPLFKAALSGSHFRQAVLAGTLSKGLLSLRLGTFFVSQFTESADVTAPEPVTDQAMLTFGIVQVVETPVSGGVKTGPSVVVTWNQIRNTANDVIV